MLESCSMAAIVEKLSAIGGNGKWLEREWRIRVRLCWHDKARSAIRHMVYGERKPSVQEAKEIELAYVKHCAERIEAHRVENAKLFHSMRSAIAAMESSDPEFFGPQLEAMRASMFRPGDSAAENGSEG